jgi:hypothetical protein
LKDETKDNETLKGRIPKEQVRSDDKITFDDKGDKDGNNREEVKTNEGENIKKGNEQRRDRSKKGLKRSTRKKKQIASVEEDMKKKLRSELSKSSFSALALPDMSKNSSPNLERIASSSVISSIILHSSAIPSITQASGKDSQNLLEKGSFYFVIK